MEITDISSSFVIEIKLEEEKEKENKKTFFKVFQNESDFNSGKKRSKNLRINKIPKKNDNKLYSKISRVKSDKKHSKKQEGTFNVGRWSEEEHQKFMEALLKYGNNWNRVEEYIGTRNSTQARSHAQKFFVNIGKTKIQKLDLDFQNNSLRSLSLLVNNLGEEQIASSLRNLNDKVLVGKKEKKYSNELNSDSSTESDSINLKKKRKR
jgi:SHAQKYF class myb-like DNA-binding protein